MTTVALVAASSRANIPPSALGFQDPPRSFAPKSPEADRSTALLSRLLTDAFDALDSDRDIARTSLSRAVALLEAERTLRPAAREVADPGALAPWQCKKAVAHIDDNLASTIRIGDLAGLARLSTSYFSRAFKSTFGHTPQQFILDRRVARAQHVMLTSEETLCNIALTCGFSDQAHLSRVFRRVVGASPAEWRRARRAAPKPITYDRPYEA
jgi:AraC-like DNA-binding protein